MGAMPANPQTLFGEATETFGPAIQRLVRGYEADPARQEELRQDIMLALWRALRTFRGDSSLRTFVFRVAHNTAISHVHKSVRDRSEPGLDDAAVAAPGPAAEATLDRARRREELTAAIRLLPDLDREVVLLNLEGLANGEVAEVTGLSVSNVGTRLTRIRQRLIEIVGGKR